MARNDFQPNGYLMHHGILGMKWGVRRYQNPDGSLTPAGRSRYGVKEGGSEITTAKGMTKRLNDIEKAKVLNKAYYNQAQQKGMKLSNKAKKAKTDEKHDELNRKAEESFKESGTYLKNIEKGNKEITSLLEKSKEMGYDINSKQVNDLAMTSQEKLKSALIYAATGFITFKTTTKTKYKVKDNKARERTSIDIALEKGLAEYNAAKKEARDYDKKTKWDEWDEQKSDDLHRIAAEKNPTTNKNSEYRKAIKDRVEYAKNTGKFDMEFLERNLDLDPATEKQMKGEKLAKAYEKFLLEEYEKKHK